MKFEVELSDEELAALYLSLRTRILSFVSGLDRPSIGDDALAKIVKASGYEPKEGV